MTPKQLREIEDAWAQDEIFHKDYCSYKNVYFSAKTDIQALIAEVRRLQELLDYEKVNHAEAREEVKRLNLINENGWGPDALRKHLKEAAGNG